MLIFGRERKYASKHLKEHHAQRPDINLKVIALAPKHLWRIIRHLPDTLLQVALELEGGGAGEGVELDDHLRGGVRVEVHQKVFCGNVSVDDVALVAFLHGQ